MNGKEGKSHRIYRIRTCTWLSHEEGQERYCCGISNTPIIWVSKGRNSRIFLLMGRSLLQLKMQLSLWWNYGIHLRCTSGWSRAHVGWWHCCCSQHHSSIKCAQDETLGDRISPCLWGSWCIIVQCHLLVKNVLFRVPAHVYERDMLLKGLQVDKNWPVILLCEIVHYVHPWK